MRHHIIAIVAALSLTACASMQPPTGAELAAADYGSIVSKDRALQLAHGLMDPQMKDPYSAVWECGEPYQGWAADGALYGGKKHFGYVMDCTINGKNSYGGYVGQRQHKFVINNETVIAAYGEQSLSSGGTYMAKIR